MRNAPEVHNSPLTDYLTAAVIIMAITFGPAVVWMLR